MSLFDRLADEALRNLPGHAPLRSAFVDEMQRFLPSQLAAETVATDAFWTYLLNLLAEESRRILAAPSG